MVNHRVLVVAIDIASEVAIVSSLYKPVPIMLLVLHYSFQNFSRFLPIFLLLNPML